MSNPAKIFATLKEIKYTTKISGTLPVCSALSKKKNFIRQSESGEYAFSQWITPKRTRSFPLAYVYNTLHKNNRVTIIPFCKDEGVDGDMDFLQWDSISLMSLLGVYVIVGYYVRATKNNRPGQQMKNKITNQVFDYIYVDQKFDELQNYKSGPLHWNVQQIEKLSDVAKLTLDSYKKIAQSTGVRLHNESIIRKRIGVLQNDLNKFKDSSRQGAQVAQRAEGQTDQPKEKTIEKKSLLTLTNLLGGEYYWTADEGFVLDQCVFLIEKKHSNRKVLPGPLDIKDAFIKMALFSNIDRLQYDDVAMPYYAAVGLTSNVVNGFLHSNMSKSEIDKFCGSNSFKPKDKKFLLSVIEEANVNNFGLFIVNSNITKSGQDSILRQLRN